MSAFGGFCFKLWKQARRCGPGEDRMQFWRRKVCFIDSETKGQLADKYDKSCPNLDNQNLNTKEEKYKNIISDQANSG